MSGLKVTVLGCGSSSGVPEIGCDCAVCRSDDPKNKRTRVSILIETQGKALLVDTSPDLRQQALRHGIGSVDAILYTHDHADHLHGIDDIRAFNARRDALIPAYGDRKTLEALKTRFGYIFQPRPQGVWFRPGLEAVEIGEDLQDFTVEGIKITPILQEHARTTSLGFRIGDFAYCTDVNGFSEASFARLGGLKLWIVDCLRYRPSVTHSRLETTLEWVARLKPERTVFTHMAHDFDYDTLKGELPPGVEPGYDGLIIEL